MSKLDAVRQRERVVRLAPVRGRRSALPSLSASTCRQFEALYQSLESSLTGGGKVVAFTASRPGEGTTTIVRGFAGFLVASLNAAVLVVDASNDRTMAAGQPAAAVPLAEILRGLPENSGSSNGGFAGGRERFGTACLALDVFNRPAMRENAAQITDLARLRMHFDYALFDLPAVAAHPTAVSIGRHVDGVVIIVEAEHTRWPVVESTKRAYEAAGANVVGIVLNKRRFYIPDPIYARL
jgi:Mrp family chromosome partitioning ATPase